MKYWVRLVPARSSAAVLLQLMLFSAFRWQSAMVEGRKDLVKMRDGTRSLAEAQVNEEDLASRVRYFRVLCWCMRPSERCESAPCRVAIDFAQGPKRNLKTLALGETFDCNRGFLVERFSVAFNFRCIELRSWCADARPRRRRVVQNVGSYKTVSGKEGRRRRHQRRKARVITS